MKDLRNLYGATYILAAGIFEMTFIYGFLRMSFEEALERFAENL